MTIISEALLSVQIRICLFFVNIFMGSVQEYTKIYKMTCTNMPTFNKHQIMDNLASLSLNTSLLYYFEAKQISDSKYYVVLF